MKRIFCIGLHKTGTSSLCEYATSRKIKSIHSVKWPRSVNIISNYRFFCDGGSHFNGLNEFDFMHLYKTYQHSLFILQTRDMKSWLISKCKHAGWTYDTKIEPDDYGEILKGNWKYKSLMNIEYFVIHKYDYEKRVVDFFNQHDKRRLLIIDVTTPETNVCKILDQYIGLSTPSNNNNNHFFHANKSKNVSDLHPIVLDFMDQIIEKYKINIQTTNQC